MKRSIAAGALAALLAACSSGGSSLPPAPTPSAAGLPAALQQISSDPFTGGGSQHATEVEPSAAAAGNTIVAVFQTGRYYSAGASDTGFAASFDGGATWQHGELPGTTLYALPPGPFDSISDPSVAYDARAGVWLIAGLPVFFSGAAAPGFVVSRSSDGVTWSAPVDGTPFDETSADKDWIACDDHPQSPYFGNCYAEWDEYAGAGTISLSVSRDGGATWSAPAHPASGGGGIGGQPVVQPNGNVVVPIDDLTAQHVLVFSSADGGVTWSQPAIVASIADHTEAGGLRSLPLISAAADAGGTVYVVWQDCRFRTACAQNDLVIIASADGRNWTPPARIPVDALSSGADHFLPGLGVDAATSGTGAHLGVTFYSYADTKCSVATCALAAQFIFSNDGGATWMPPQTLGSPMQLSWLAQTKDGAMVGDYLATVFASGEPVGFAAIASAPAGTLFREAMNAPLRGALNVASAARRSSAGERPVRGFRADHPPRRLHP